MAYELCAGKQPSSGVIVPSGARIVDLSGHGLVDRAIDALPDGHGASGRCAGVVGVSVSTTPAPYDCTA